MSLYWVCNHWTELEIIGCLSIFIKQLAYKILTMHLCLFILRLRSILIKFISHIIIWLVHGTIIIIIKFFSIDFLEFWETWRVKKSVSSLIFFHFSSYVIICDPQDNFAQASEAYKKMKMWVFYQKYCKMFLYCRLIWNFLILKFMKTAFWTTLAFYLCQNTIASSHIWS